MSRTYRRDHDEYGGRFDRARRKSARGKKQIDDRYDRDFEPVKDEDGRLDEREAAGFEQAQRTEPEEEEC
jgi:hypothetical protein